MPYRARVSLARLYLDWLTYVRWIQLLHSTCEHKGGFPTDCCDAHRHLDVVLGGLKSRAVHLSAGQESTSHVLSSLWWSV